jgi:hypothetical protein
VIAGLPENDNPAGGQAFIIRKLAQYASCGAGM